MEDDILTRGMDYVGKLCNMLSRSMNMLCEKSILFTGEGPYFADDIVDILPDEVDCYGDGTEGNPLPKFSQDINIDYIVIGQYEYDVEMVYSLLFGLIKTRVTCQEGFLDMCLFGRDWTTPRFVRKLNLAAEYHKGLQFVKGLTWFPWPSTEASETNGSSSEIDTEFALKSEFFELGYSIRDNGRKRTREERWSALMKCIQKFNLEQVANHIASLIRARKKQTDGRERFAYAIQEWEYDLDRLKLEIYYRVTSTFGWPTTEPYG